MSASTEDGRGARTRALGLPVALATLLLAGTFGGLIGRPLSAPGESTASLSLTLYGTAAGGWSFTSGTETNPGPTITANPGDTMTIHMISEDAPTPLPHGVFIDFNNNGVIDIGTDYSSPTGIDETFTFTVSSLAGSHYYYCSIHSPDVNGRYAPGAPMYGVFVVNRKPSATFAAPTGSTSWTADVAHDIVFNLVDEDPGDALTVWVNYSYGGGAQGGTVAGPIAGTANPNRVSWTPTGFEATDVVINVTAIDSGGLRGSSLSAPFEVDGTAPTIAARSPAPDAIDVARNSRVRVTWSEGMNETESGGSSAFSVRRVSDGAWISGTTLWSPNRTVMTFAPSAIWDATTAFEVLVNGTAEDDSDPGNRVAGPSTWQFTTGTVIDATPPVIATASASPTPQEAGGSVTILADVTDDDAVATVSARVQGPSMDVNLTMSIGAGTTWSVARTYTALGAYSFTVWALDLAGNAASSAGGFTIEDRTAPVIAAVAAVPTSSMPNGAVNLTAQVTDNAGLANMNAHVVGPGVDVNLTMSRGSGTTWYANRTYSDLGSYAFTVWAVDVAGNAASRSGSFSIAQAPPPPAPSAVEAHAQSDGTIMVMWSPVSGGTVAGYNVYRGASAGGPFTKLTPTPIPAAGLLEYVDSNVQPGVTYYYAVTAVDAGGNESPLSTPASATISGPPPSDSLLWFGLAIVAVVLVTASVVVVRRRKR